MASINEIKEIIEDTVTTAMANEVFDAATKALYDAAREVVYKGYNPKDYSRRRTFEEEKGYEFSYNEMSMTITANAEFNDRGNTEANSGNLAELVYGGNGSGGVYGWTPPNDREPTYLYPRPWVDVASNQLKGNNILKTAVTNALKSRGFKVR